jgi:hypothetical protein
MPKRPHDQQAKAIARVRTKFREHCHASLDAYLSEPDETTGLPTIDVLIAYMGQGWGISVGVQCREPESDAPANGETKTEADVGRAAFGRIEVVRS